MIIAEFFAYLGAGIMKKILSKSVKIIDVIIEWTGIVFSYGEYLMLFALLYEVISRYFFNSPTIWAGEFSMYVFGAVGVISGAYILKNDAHIRVDIFYTMYPKRVKAIVDIIAVLFVIFWGVLLIHYGWPYFLKTLARNELSITSWRAPLWPVRLMIPVAGVLLIIAAISKGIKNFYTAITGGDL